MEDTKPSQELIREAIDIFGKTKVIEVMQIVGLSDPDGAYTMLQDMGDEEGAEIVEMLYFE
jgi:hypothetical protein